MKKINNVWSFSSISMYLIIISSWCSTVFKNSFCNLLNTPEKGTQTITALQGLYVQLEQVFYRFHPRLGSPETIDVLVSFKCKQSLSPNGLIPWARDSKRTLNNTRFAEQVVAAETGMASLKLRAVLFPGWCKWKPSILVNCPDLLTPWWPPASVTKKYRLK